MSAVDLLRALSVWRGWPSHIRGVARIYALSMLRLIFYRMGKLSHKPY